MTDVNAWVSAEFQSLAEIIYDYDSSLFLEMIPVAEQQHLLDKSKVFRIVDDRTKTVVMYFDFLTNPQEILTRLWQSDLDKGDLLGRLETANRAAEVLKLKRKEDEMAAAKDFSAFILNNTKSRWTHEGRVRDEEFRDLGPIRKVID